MTEPLSVALDLYKHSSSSVDSLWGLYSGAVLALLGYILGATSVPDRAKIGLGIAFLLFACSNAAALYSAQNTAVAAIAAATAIATDEKLKDVISTLHASPPYLVAGTQIFATIFALLAIGWAHRQDTAKQQNIQP